MVMCAVFGCNNNNGNKKTSSQAGKVSYFSFPKDKRLRDVWVSKCSRKDVFNIKFSRVCSQHFAEQDFVRNFKDEFLRPDNIRRKLIEGAIPSQKLPNMKIVSSAATNRQERHKKKLKDAEKKQIIADALTGPLQDDNSMEIKVIVDKKKATNFVATDQSDTLQELRELLKGSQESIEGLKEDVKKLKKEISILKKENKKKKENDHTYFKNNIETPSDSSF